MMEIKVLFFGILRDIVGENAMDFTIDSKTTIASLKTIMVEKFQGLAKFSNFSIAVNEAYVNGDYVLQQNDVVALIPPVSGG